MFIDVRDTIREWAEGEVIGGPLLVIESELRPNGVRLPTHWAPAGSDGRQAYYTFEARGGPIAVANLLSHRGRQAKGDLRKYDSRVRLKRSGAASA